jgi:hypothetical protein
MASLLGHSALGALRGASTSFANEAKGPAQKAGEVIDKGIQSAKETINPPGPAEKVERGLDKALDK